LEVPQNGELMIRIFPVEDKPVAAQKPEKSRVYRYFSPAFLD